MLLSREQRYTSAKTARRQVPGAFKTIARLGGFKRGWYNLDVGGGPWPEGSDWLMQQHGVTSLVYDPFNRTPEHNAALLRALAGLHGVDTATLCNVLNVVAEDWARRDALELARWYLRPCGTCWVDVYEGDGTGRGRATAYGWQENRRLATYLDEVRAVFPGAELVRGKGIIRAAVPA